MELLKLIVFVFNKCTAGAMLAIATAAIVAIATFILVPSLPE